MGASSVTVEARGRAPGLVSLWFATLGGPVLWALHLLVSYFLATWHDAGGLRHLDLWLHLVTVGFALMIIASGLVAWRIWRQSGIDGDTEAGGPPGRSGFMALAGLGLNALFLIFILFTDLTTLVVPVRG
jgi:hypothetical protein